MASNQFAYWSSQQGLACLKDWSGAGMTEEQVLKKIGVSSVTWRKWKKMCPALTGALKDGGDAADCEIESALLKKASGYTVDVVKTYKVKRIEYEDGKKVCEFEELAQGVDQVHVPADLAAQIFWLKNRKPEKWRDKPEVNTEGAALQKLDEMMGEWKDAVEQETD